MNDTQASSLASEADWKAGVVFDTGQLARRGYLAFAGLLGVFFLWALLFPLSSAVVASGKIVSAGQNKVLQHPTGGIVREIAAENGDFLEVGDKVVVIDPLAAIAELDRLRARQTLLRAKRRRLETAGGEALPLHWDILDARGSIMPTGNDHDAESRVFSQQAAETEAREARFRNELVALTSQLDSVRSEATGTITRIAAQERLVMILTEQHDRMVPIAEAGHIARSQLWETQSRLIDAQARLGELRAALTALEAREAEHKSRVDAFVAGKAVEDARELSDVLTELAAIDGQIDAAALAVDLTHIKAPVAGRLTNLITHTVGGVLTAGETIGEIVPEGGGYQVEARIAPPDIAAVELGQTAEVVITAHNRRLFDPIVAEVTYVGADSRFDEVTGTNFFPVHLTIDATSISDRAVQSGMETEVYLQVAGRSFFSYVLQPIADSFQRAFRER